MSTVKADSMFQHLANIPAPGPHPAYRDQLMLFGQFVGVWDMDIAFFDETGKTLWHGPGEWAFGWVLDGRVVQDVLTSADLDDPKATAPGDRRIGTSLRHYHPGTGRWRVVWLGAVSGVLVVLEGGRVGDEIVIEGQEGESRIRWMFTEIADDYFHWKGLTSSDGGASWRMEQEMFARRRNSASGNGPDMEDTAILQARPERD